MSATVSLTVDELRRAYARVRGYSADDPSYHERQAIDAFLEVLADQDVEGATAFEPTLLSALDIAPPPPLLLDRLDPIEHTILYGPGGVGKGSLAASWIVRLTQAGHNVLILDYEDHGGEWGRRIEGLGGIEARQRVAWIAPFRVGLGPIGESAPAIGRLMAQQPGNPYLVVDSAVMACAGGDPMDPATATRFFEALQVIGVPSLTLAHVTKLHDARYPFGSVFWHNLARVTWSLMEKRGDVLLSCQKANNYIKPPASLVSATWYEGWLREVAERPALVTLTDQIVEVLEAGPMTAPAITAVLNEGIPASEHTSGDVVRVALNRELKRGEARRVMAIEGGQWSLRSEGAIAGAYP